ncbi:unnamed protein product [Meloidogyne enterolobii]|uniref:Uncharacterized protein n=1 Tax=Meloidogyne enterolobii TaxID=390850 RepID=A0ACB0XRW5_MELEN
MFSNYFSSLANFTNSYFIRDISQSFGVQDEHPEVDPHGILL